MEHEPEAAEGQAATAETDTGLVFHLEVSMSVHHMTAVRRFVAELAHSIVKDLDLASRLALAAHELLENAVKYSVNPARLVTLRLSAVAERSVCITVMNASNEELAAPLYELVAELNGATDRQAHYQYMIQRSMDRESGSGLGLARISAEGDMHLNCELRRGILSVTAEARIGDRP
jgi:hypothetical protein